jgi:hypothetical protein
MKKFFILLFGICLLAAGCDKTVPTPQISSQNETFENSYLKFEYPKGWIVNAPALNPAAVNISKDNYILYINTQATQASGVQGGRFAEISMGALSADAVMHAQPASPCGNSESTQVTEMFTRVDLFVAAQDKTDSCNVPSGERAVWYFSYITNKAGGYFNYYDQRELKALVITLAYNSREINSFPAKDEPALKSILGETTHIIESLHVKQNK